MKFTVGQIMWAVGIDRPSLKVFQIVEEITKKTIGEEKTSYILKGPANNSKITLEEILQSNLVFKSAEEAHVSMIKTASEAIDRAIEKTKLVADEAFRNKEKTIVATSLPTSSNKKNSNITKIELEDGTIANVTLPKVRR